MWWFNASFLKRSCVEAAVSWRRRRVAWWSDGERVKSVDYGRRRKIKIASDSEVYRDVSVHLLLFPPPPHPSFFSSEPWLHTCLSHSLMRRTIPPFLFKCLRVLFITIKSLMRSFCFILSDFSKNPFSKI